MFLGTGGSASYSLSSPSGTTQFLAGTSGIVNGHYVLGGSTVPYTLSAPGDSVTHSYTLGNGTADYNMGPGNTATTSYNLNPSGGSTGTNTNLITPSGVSSSQMGPSSLANVLATLSAGDTQSYTLGSGDSATVTTVIGGVTNTVTLGSGDSATTTADSGTATGTTNDTLSGDTPTPGAASTTYNVGTDGSTSSTYGADTYNVYIIRNAYGISRGGTFASTPLISVIAAGSAGDIASTPWNEGTDKQVYYDIYGNITQISIIVPGSLDPVNGGMFAGDAINKFQTAQASPYIAQYNCQRVLIAQVKYNAGSKKWDVYQYLEGPVTLPNNLIHGGVFFYSPDTLVDNLPNWLTTPDFESQEVAFENPWSGSDKFTGGGLLPSVAITPNL